MRVSDLDTPALLIDLDVMERNLRTMADYTAAHGLRLRPHTKTHKIPALGRRQVELGAAGLTVAKVGEAEVMVSSDTPDLLVAYPTIGRRKLERLMEVARRTRVTVALDSEAALDELGGAAREANVKIGVLAEVDVGLYRVGVSPGEDLINLVRAVTRQPWLEYDGIDFYSGHIKFVDLDGRKALDALGTLLAEIVESLTRAGLAPRIVSGGSTPTWMHSHKLKGLNEIRPGTYIFNDKNTVASGACRLEDCAASILTTVVSTSRPGQAIIDGGSKTFSSDRLVAPDDPGHGYVREAPGAVFHKMNEEHGFLDLAKAGRSFRVGDRVHVIPNHICVAVNLHETIYGIRGETVDTCWKVEGRGKLQ